MISNINKEVNVNKNKVEDSFYEENLKLTKRVANIGLLFISLNETGKNFVLMWFTCQKIGSNLSEMKNNYKETLPIFLKSVFLNSFQISITVGVVFKFKSAIYVNVCMQLINNLNKIINSIKNKDKKEFCAQLLNTIQLSLTLSLIYRKTLQKSFALVLVQAAIQMCEAEIEWEKGNIPEAISKILIGAFKLNQSYEMYQVIREHNRIFNFFKESIGNAKNNEHLKNSELLNKKEEVIKTDANGVQYHFGEHYHGFGKGIVKGMNLQFRNEVIDGKEVRVLDFKVNQVFRRELETTIKNYKSIESDKVTRFFCNRLPNVQAVNIQIKKTHFGNIKPNLVHHLEFTGLGSITIGDEVNTLHDRIRIEIEKNQSIFDFHQLLALINLEEVLYPSSEDDIERLKIGHLFRVFYPQEACYLEKTKKFFELPIEELKSEIEMVVPEMKETFQTHLSTMVTTEILPGRLRYTIPQLSDMVKEIGGEALVATITTQNNDELIERTISTLKMGLISSEMRFTNGININGLCSDKNFDYNGADSVFTQFVTKQTFNRLDNFGYRGKVRLILSLDLLNTGTYQYHDDCLGYRNHQSCLDQKLYFESVFKNNYIYRPNIVNFALRENQKNNTCNEVMIKEVIPENKIIGVWINDPQLRLKLIDQMRVQGLIQKDNDGTEAINGKPVSQFVLGNAN